VHADLEELIGTDEAARIRLEEAERTARHRLEAARADLQRDRRERRRTLEATLERDVAEIAAAAEREVRRRADDRARHLAACAATAEPLLERAAALFAAAIRDGPDTGAE
jgi:hypothetical protein